MILIGGGSRSGKSRHALELAARYGPRRAFVATAQALDDEMRDRIARHRAERSPDWDTHEVPLHLAPWIESHSARYDVVVVDCLTLWLSNLVLTSQADPAAESAALVQAAAASPAVCILVTNEVGCGIVPENALARAFRDHAGRLNQLAARSAQEAYWMAFGIPLRLK